MTGRRYRDGAPVVGSRAVKGGCMHDVLGALQQATAPLTITELRVKTGHPANRISACLHKLQSNEAIQVLPPSTGRKGHFYQLRNCGMRMTDSLSPADTREQAYVLLSRSAPKAVMVDSSLKQGEWFLVRAPYEHERKLMEEGKA